MSSKKQQWKTYCEAQLQAIVPLLLREGFELEDEQPHIKGERYILSGKKLVLYGTEIKTKKRVVIKITNDPEQAQALRHERDCKEALQQIHFAYQTFFAPKEILFGYHEPYTFFITQYIPQDKPFLDHTNTEQFFFALKAFEAQESFHATTHGHFRAIQQLFDVYTADTYIQNLNTYKQALGASQQELFSSVIASCTEASTVINRYSDFLTHWDFVPHNLRIHEGNIYLLDYTAFRFGNKYEGWARFLNFMTLYNSDLEALLTEYVEKNRSSDEREALRLMRMYRASELVWFYTKKRSRAEGALIELTDARIAFWTEVLTALQNNVPLERHVVEAYKKKRDTLRDADEKSRQKGLH
jgi:hypothetical protein